MNQLNRKQIIVKCLVRFYFCSCIYLYIQIKGDENVETVSFQIYIFRWGYGDDFHCMITQKNSTFCMYVVHSAQAANFSGCDQRERRGEMGCLGFQVDISVHVG